MLNQSSEGSVYLHPSWKIPSVESQRDRSRMPFQTCSEDLSAYKLVRRGQFAYATNHIEEGSIGLQDICDVGLVSPMYTVFKVDEDQVDTSFLFRLLKTETYRQIFASATHSSIDRRGALRWAGF